MKKEQALQILKQFIDLAISKGICQNIESVAQLSTALQTVAKENE